MLKEGPTDTVIPKQEYKTCVGCAHYNQNLVMSGAHPRYSYNCNHPQVKQFILIGNLYKNRVGIIETPHWCPYLKNDTNKTST